MNTFKKFVAVIVTVGFLPLPGQAAVLAVAAKAPAPVALGAVIASPSASVLSGLSAPAALQPLNAAPSLVATSIPTRPTIRAAALTAAPALVPVKPSLEALAARVSAVSRPGSPEAGDVLDRTYAGARLAASVEAPEFPEQPPKKASELTPASSDEPSQPARAPAPRNSQAGKSRVGLIAGIAGAVIAVAILIAVLVHNGNKKNEVWEQSKAKQETVLIDQARRAGDAQTLFRISAEARQRQQTPQDADPDKAKTYEAFDGLAAMRGGANGNAVSTQPEQRPGGQLPSTWRDRLSSEEAAARQSGNVADLARGLSELRAELERENAVGSVFAEDLRKFKGEVPTFGGAMGEQADIASRDLNEFRAESGAEQALYDQHYAAMRSIVTERLAAANPEFRAALDRADRLSVVAGGALSTLDDLADNIDRDFRDMSASRRAQRDNLAEAARHTADPVLDANGKPVLDADGNPATQDNSQSWRDRAAKNAADAQAAAASAKSNIEAFNRDVKTLRGDRTLQAEGLDRSLPRAAAVGRPDWEHGISRDLLDPWQLDMAGNNFTEAEANDARARFGTAKGSVTSVQTSVDQRKQEVRRSVDAAVDAEIRRQTKGW